ncbi:MAG: SCO family protein [Terrimicrobiaceae bacterium]
MISPKHLAAVLAVLQVQFLSAADTGWFGKIPHPLREAPPIELTDQNGNPFRLADQRGNAVLVAFGFTCCPNICPVMLSQLAAVRRELPEDQRKLTKVFFISVDDRDTAQSLAEYLPLFDGDFTGLTGTPEAISSVVRSYGGFFRDAPGGDLIDHSTDVYLIDPQGRLRALFSRGQLSETARIAADISRVLENP